MTFPAATWPYAFSEEAMELSVQASSAFQSGLDLHPTWKNLYFNTSFSNGTASTQLPAIFITPDSSHKLPLVIITTGTDYTKEVSNAAPHYFLPEEEGSAMSVCTTLSSPKWEEFGAAGLESNIQLCFWLPLRPPAGQNHSPASKQWQIKSGLNNWWAQITPADCQREEKADLAYLAIN